MVTSKHTIRTYFQPAFLLCVIVLACACVVMAIVLPGIGDKQFCPLMKPLDRLDEHDLSPFEVVDKRVIDNADVVMELGTEDYIQWILEDTETESGSPVHRYMLFITYYGLPDRVPHVPEECYTGGGHQRLASDSVTFDVKGDEYEKRLDGKYLVFGSVETNSWRTGHKFPVLYFFKVNGEYANSRDEARIALNKNLFGRYSYFSKVEIVFNQDAFAPGKEEATKAAGKLLGVILPILEQAHWPDWENLNKKD